MKLSSPEFRFFIRRSGLTPAFILALLAVAPPVSAHVRIQERRHYLVQRESHHVQLSRWAVRQRGESEPVSGYHPGGTVTVSTAAGPITVASDAADKFVSLTNDLVAHGFHGSVTCAATGHMPNSLHHTGHACDFAQTARNRTVGIMYHVSDIIAAHGLRDGCSFGDCGHVDTGTPLEGHRFAAASGRHQAVRVAYQDHGSGQPGAASWHGASEVTTASFAPARQRYVRVAARETGRAVVMGFRNRGPVARERFLEVSGGAASSYDLVRRRWVESK